MAYRHCMIMLRMIDSFADSPKHEMIWLGAGAMSGRFGSGASSCRGAEGCDRHSSSSS